MDKSKAVALAWMLSVVVIAGTSLTFVLSLDKPGASEKPFAISNLLLTGIYTIAFGVVGAMILGRQPRNTIGWLLIAIGVFLSVGGGIQEYLGQIASTAPALDWTGYLSIWLSGWTWWLLIGPLLLVLLVFPTGRLLSPRWRWVVVLIAVVFASFLIIATASPMWQDPNSGQIVPNPLGVMPVEISFEAIQAPWSIGLLSAVGLCVISVLLRHRRAGAVEREQLKWFFYACGIFLAVYAPGFLIQSDAPDLFGVLFGFAILFIPVSIGIAILRYRLFDIDIIIRRTLIYSVLTAILAFLYLGSVIALQQLLRALTGAESELAIIVSTLAIVALFTPLRRRVQGTIDHRFYRRRYDATQVLAGFGTTARDEIELDRLTGELVSLVHETMQPATVSFWVRKGTSPTVK